MHELEGEARRLKAKFEAETRRELDCGRKTVRVCVAGRLEEGEEGAQSSRRRPGKSVARKAVWGGMGCEAQGLKGVE